MKKLALALAAAAALVATAALADYTIRDAATGVALPVQAFDCNGKICPQNTIVDQFGAPIGTAQNPLVFGGFATRSVAQLARSANTTTYTVNTAWNNSSSPAFFSFQNACAANGKQVLVPQIDLWSTANPTLKLQGLLWLFSGVPGTNVADNANFVIQPSDFENLTGPAQGIPFALAGAQGSGAQNSGVSLVGNTYQMNCPSNSTTITGMVQVTIGYVPASGEVLKIALRTSGAN